MTTHVVIEASISISDNDINRAADRATTLALVVGTPALPAVVGARIDQTRRELAAALEVSVISMPEDY